MDSSQHHGSEIARLIWIVGSPIVFAVGVPGNLITITVLLRSKHRKSSTSVFLTFLAFADLLLLTITFPRWWIIYLFGMDIRHISNAFCKVHWLFTYFNGCFSSSVLVAVTIERIISIKRPYKVKTWCTVNTAIITSIAIIMFLIAFHGHNLHGMKLFSVTQYQVDHDGVNDTIGCLENPNQLDSFNDTDQMPNLTDRSVLALANQTTTRVLNVCNGTEFKICFNITGGGMVIDQKNVTCEFVLRDETSTNICWFDDPIYGSFFMGAYHLMTIFIYNVITVTSILVGIIVIVRQLAASNRLRKRMQLKIVNETGIYAKKSTFESHSAQITRSLLLICAVFIFCGTPVQIFLAGRSVWIDEENGMTMSQELIWAVCNMLYYINHAVNFILYFLSGSRFRKEVKETFRCYSRGNKLSQKALNHIMSAEMENRRSHSDYETTSSVNPF